MGSTYLKIKIQQALDIIMYSPVFEEIQFQECVQDIYKLLEEEQFSGSKFYLEKCMTIYSNNKPELRPLYLTEHLSGLLNQACTAQERFEIDTVKELYIVIEQQEKEIFQLKKDVKELYIVIEQQEKEIFQLKKEEHNKYVHIPVGDLLGPLQEDTDNLAERLKIFRQSILEETIEKNQMLDAAEKRKIEYRNRGIQKRYVLVNK